MDRHSLQVAPGDQVLLRPDGLIGMAFEVAPNALYVGTIISADFAAATVTARVRTPAGSMLGELPADAVLAILNPDYQFAGA